MSHTFQSVNRSKGQARVDDILTKQADHLLIRWVYMRRLPLKALESDQNLVYPHVRIPRTSAPNWRRKNTEKTPRMADLQRLMTDLSLRCQFVNAMIVTLPV